MKEGDIVFYTEHFDSDKSEAPNIVPAMVIKIGDTPDTLNLWVFFVNGLFSKLGVPKGTAGVRGTWHPRE